MTPTRIATRPFDDQRPGTAGLRKTVQVFRQPHYLQNFVQSIFDSCLQARGATLIVGGDGRYFNDEAIQQIIRLSAGNGVRRLIVGRYGWLSTPAASNLIRQHDADGGFLLTASHNPGGPDGDFGIKFNVRGGGQASSRLTEAVWKQTLAIEAYHTLESEDVALDEIGTFDHHGVTIDVVDPVNDYVEMLSSLFDFEQLRALLSGGAFRLRFDAMHAITGPYAVRLLEQTLGAPAGSVVNAEPLKDFGGGHPDPNPVDAAELVAFMQHDRGCDFAAASDGDGDRNMIVAPGGLVVSPGDSLAILAAHAASLPGYAGGLPGIARSMPTARAADRVAEHLGIPCYETPTGWRYFASLLEDERIGLCGEESFGTGSWHVREKDGLWAVLFWLNIVAASGRSVDELVRGHWQQFGRDYFTRHDYVIADRSAADTLMQALGERLGELPGREVCGLEVASADRFDYQDPVDGSVATDQGFRVFFTNGARAVFRLSGTGTGGATLRVYLDEHRTAPQELELDRHEVLAPAATAARQIADITALTGLDTPTAVI
jgi:phosphoglucomutase